jgi:eukaryotic-like serine/threonine-protein kinase
MIHGLDRARWSLLSPYLDDVLELPPRERATWLEGLRAQDPRLAADLEALQARYDRATVESFLEQGPPPRATMEGQVLGAYTLRESIGHGGMGSVWLADRSDGRYEGVAAVKLLNASLMGQGAEDRFRREGSILARLRHRCIAQLIDAGVSPAGQPYLVIEHVDGEHIDAYCDRRRLVVEARVRLFLDVLAAVSHAHANLIVHRDLKPSNVLVSGDGAVKLLDFGVAKLLAAEGGGSPTLTLDAPALTPEYAAPEQLTGGDITTAVDVYALGVLLYQLLSGRHPAGPLRASPVDLIRTVLEREPHRLAAVVAAEDEGSETSQARAAHRGTTRDGLRRALRGDLETIVARALKKDPSERYPSAEALAEDLRRHLEHAPIGARPDTFAYRAAKFVRRHRLPVALASALLSALVAGLAGTLWQARAAARERDIALAQVDRAENINDLNSLLLGDPPAGARASLPELLKRAEELGETRAAHDPAMAVDVLVNVGEIYAAREQPDNARRTLGRAYQLSRTITDAASRAKAACAWGRAVGFGASDPKEALGLIDEGLVFTTDEPTFDSVAVTCLLTRGAIGITRDSPTLALESGQQALERLDRRPNSLPKLRAAALQTVASGLRLAGRYAEADRVFARAFEQYRLVGPEDSTNAATLLSNWATNTAVTNPSAALDQSRRAVAPSADGSIDHAPVPRLLNCALQLSRLARHAEARAVLERVRALAQRDGHAPAAALARVRLAHSCIELSDLACGRDNLLLAAQVVPSAYPPRHRTRGDLAREQALLAEAEGRDAEAYRLMLEAYAIHGPSKEMNPTRMETLLELSRIELRRGAALEAEQHARASLAVAESFRGDTAHSSWTGRSLLALGLARDAQGAAAEARTLYVQAVDHLVPTLGDGHPAVLAARQQLAR